MRVVLAGLLLSLGCATGDAAPGAGPPTGPAPASSLESGEALYWRSEYDSARQALGGVLSRARAGNDSARAARALTWLGLAAYRKGDYDTARAESEEALALKLAIGMRDELFRSYNALGLLAWSQGRLFAAESLYVRARESALAVRDADGASRAAGNLGLVLVEFGDYAGARQQLIAMRDGARALHQPRVEANALANLAMLDIREGNPLGALAGLGQARALYSTDGDAPGQANALGQLATAYRDMGNYPAAFAAVDSAIAITRRRGMRQEEAANLEVLASLHEQLGNDAQALRALAEARVIDSALDLRVEAGTSLRSEAGILLRAGERGTALAMAQEALQRHEATAANGERLGDLLLLAEADTIDGERWIHAARALADSLYVERMDIALSAARLAERRRDWRRVMSTLDAVGAATGSTAVDRWEQADLRATALRALGRRREAAEAARQAIALVEQVRGTLPAGWSRSRFELSRAGSYAQLVEILLDQDRTAEAFAAADLSRGRGLLEHLAALDSTDTAHDSALAGLAGQDRLLRRIEMLTTRLEELDSEESTDDTAARARVRAAIGQSRREFEQATAAAKRTDGAALLGSRAASAAQVRAALRPDEALVEYLIGPERIHAFLVTPGGVSHWLLPATPLDLGSRVRIARDLAANPGSLANLAPVLETLHAQLIAPLRDAGALAGVSRLTIVPHATLSTLPFAALRDQRTGRFLIQDYVLRTVPSAASLLALGPRQGREVGAVAAFAPFPDELPGSRAETQDIERVLHEARSWMGGAATEQAVRGAASDAGVLHLATHGVLNRDNPLFSRMDLRGREGAGAAADGRLEAHEVLGLRLRGSLVFLSGCETALARSGDPFGGGEEFATLAQAFMYAGARSVIATLWRIPDRGSTPLVAEFYRNIRRMDLPAALAEAQRAMLADAAHSHPYYWAGHVLSGGA